MPHVDNDMGSFNSPSATMKAANFQTLNKKAAAAATVMTNGTMVVCYEFVTMLGASILILGILIATVNILLSIINDITGLEYPMVMSWRRKKALPASFQLVRHQFGKKFIEKLLQIEVTQ